jgi:hypothetical protein
MRPQEGIDFAATSPSPTTTYSSRSTGPSTTTTETPGTNPASTGPTSSSILGSRYRLGGTRNLRIQIKTLIDAGLVTHTRRRGRERWGLTDDGRARATIARLAGTELPDSPQRRDWLACRAQAGAKIEDVRTRLGEALQDAQTLLGSGGGGSGAWYAIADRVGREAKRLGGALFCLNEWPEPDEENPDVDSQSEYNRRIDVARTRLSERSYCL